jgi:alkylation response protein AidB-like acyl-CoA dehydrogenase
VVKDAISGEQQARRTMMTTTMKRGEPDLQAAVKRLRPVIEQYREQAEQERKLPEPVVTAMRKEGLFNLLLPREFGGAEIDLPAYFSAIEEISAIDSVAGWNFVIMATGAVQAAFLPEAGAREVFGDGALTAGSVIPAGRAVPVTAATGSAGAGR